MKLTLHHAAAGDNPASRRIARRFNLSLTHARLVAKLAGFAMEAQ